jgi:hypothetical protein
MGDDDDSTVDGMLRCLGGEPRRFRDPPSELAAAKPPDMGARGNRGEQQELSEACASRKTQHLTNIDVKIAETLNIAIATR